MQRIDERRFKTIVEQATRDTLNEQLLNEMGIVKGLGKMGKGIWNAGKSLLGVGNKKAALDVAERMTPIFSRGATAAQAEEALNALGKATNMMKNTTRARWGLGAGLAGLAAGSMLGGGGQQPQTPPPGLMPPMSDPYAGYGYGDPYAGYGYGDPYAGYYSGYSDPYAGYGYDYGYGDPYAGYYGY